MFNTSNSEAYPSTKPRRRQNDPKGCSIGELRDTIRDIHLLAEKISITLEAELQYNHQVFSTLTESVLDGILITDERGIIRVTSEPALKLLKASALEGLNGTDIGSVFPSIEGYVSGVDKSWKPVLLNYRGNSLDLEAIVSRLGPPSPYRTAGSLLDGSPTGLRVSTHVGSDCVILIRARITASTLNILPRPSVPTYILYCDLEGNILNGSEDAVKLLRGTRDIGNLRISNIFSDDLVKACNPNAAKSIHNIDVLYTHVEVAPLDIRDLVIHKSNVLNAQGTKTLSFSITIFDTTNVSTVPAESWVWAEYRKMLNDTKPRALVLCSSGKVLYLNKYFNTSLGATGLELIGRRLSAILYRPPFPAELSDRIDRELCCSTVWETQVQLCYLNKGIPVSYTLQIVPVKSPNGSPSNYCSVSIFPESSRKLDL